MWRKDFSGDEKMINSEIKCPNCFKILPTKPKRKKECPHCGKFIFVRNGQLVTEDESVITDWLEFFAEFQVSRQYIYESREKLKVKIGHQPSISETLWAILNELLIRFENNNFALEKLYLAMARLGSSEDKDPIQYLLEAERHKKQHQKKLLDEFDIEVNGEEDEDDYVITGREILFGHGELAYIRRLSKKGDFNKAEKMLMRAIPSPAVLDELRKLASTRARIAKNQGDWKSVIEYLEGYTKYAAQWKKFLALTHDVPPPHTTTDTNLLDKAKNSTS